MNNIDSAHLPRPILSNHPEWLELYYKAWALAARHIRVSKAGRSYMDAAWDPTRNYQWVWDTVFMTLYCRYAPDQYPGIQSVDNFYDLQRPDGYISMTYDMDTGEEPWPDRINPPLFAWAEWEYYQSTGDESRLARVVPHIERLMDWVDAHRRTAPHRRLIRDKLDRPAEDVPDDFQLYWFADAGSSGMDDSPRAPRVHGAGQHFDWVDLSCQMALSFRMLSKIHAVVGNSDRADRWARRWRELGTLINRELWCERTRFYHDRMLPTNFVPSKTVAGFWPLIAGLCPADRRDALVAHLMDEREFNRPTPVPSLSADDPNYCPRGTYWTGGIWAPTNYMIARGMAQNGRTDVAHQVAVRYLDALARTYAAIEPHTLWECYSPEEDLPGLAAYTGKRVKPDFVGWTGLGPIAMLVENIIGLDLDVPNRRVRWSINLLEEHGVENLLVGSSGRASFICKARTSAGAPAQVQIVSDVDLTVELHCCDRHQRVDVRSDCATRAAV